MDKALIKLLLQELNARLRDANLEIELHIVGGAALILGGYMRATAVIDTIDEH
jgi:hypothetical protein